MQRFAQRVTPVSASASNRSALWKACTFATEMHPNPGNFANRSKNELARIGSQGGKKGGKAKGVGGFHDMDPEKRHEIASMGGRATNKSTQRATPPRRSSRGTVNTATAAAAPTR